MSQTLKSKTASTGEGGGLWQVNESVNNSALPELLTGVTGIFKVINLDHKEKSVNINTVLFNECPPGRQYGCMTAMAYIGTCLVVGYTGKQEQFNTDTDKW